MTHAGATLTGASPTKKSPTGTFNGAKKICIPYFIPLKMVKRLLPPYEKFGGYTAAFINKETRVY